MPLPDDILAYHASLAPADRAICDALARAIEARYAGSKAPPDVSRKVWHRHPVWFINANPIVGYHTLKGGKGVPRCVRLLFWSGQSFDEPDLPPDPPGTRFKTAAARFTAADQIRPRTVARWLTKAANIQWDYKNIVKRKGKLLRLT